MMLMLAMATVAWVEQTGTMGMDMDGSQLWALGSHQVYRRRGVSFEVVECWTTECVELVNLLPAGNEQHEVGMLLLRMNGDGELNLCSTWMLLV